MQKNTPSPINVLVTVLFVSCHNKLYVALFRVLATGAVSDRIPPALHLFRNFSIPEDDKEPDENAKFAPLSKPKGKFYLVKVNNYHLLLYS